MRAECAHFQLHLSLFEASTPRNRPDRSCEEIHIDPQVTTHPRCESYMFSSCVYSCSKPLLQSSIDGWPAPAGRVAQRQEAASFFRFSHSRFTGTEQLLVPSAPARWAGPPASAS